MRRRQLISEESRRAAKVKLTVAVKVLVCEASNGNTLSVGKSEPDFAMEGCKINPSTSDKIE